MCGEYTRTQFRPKMPMGSPPRVWGILQFGRRYYEYFGITPTCVGNTNGSPSKEAEEQDHPHVCGEYREAGDGGGASKGSPPRVWGIPTSGSMSNG